MPSTKSRLFFAAFPDESVRKQLAALSQNHKQLLSRPHHPLDLHMTLAFLGIQPGDKKSCFEEVGEQIAQEGFELLVDRVGYWKGARILLVEPSATPDSLLQLVDQIWQGAEGCGVEREVRRYRPHVTLQRKVRLTAEQEIRPIRWRLESFSLTESTGNGEVPRYRRVQTWPLSSNKK
ncbi:RNA 2',3'-cyclic phosphodiesterase [Solemya elarraichensis gill symbiont]|uniref:RNA 2',3'-cyclic phosphodiesterase n=1 Tax=Solemya elarraichensis gill symbiont TaxID=1918949 RepID=A0A1T2L867_9GAMM|nr:RNA 2',3'-cyclic phosphodiesterase [Solemya elarraichensis gill symbiont]OOZ41297.1 2'-5' RNA ligase [Solemya elarraichensis gill symbiont]